MIKILLTWTFYYYPNVDKHTKAGKHPHLVLIISHIFAPDVEAILWYLKFKMMKMTLIFLSAYTLTNRTKQYNFHI